MMREYARIATKMVETPWLITEPGLKVVLKIFEARVNGLAKDDQELAIRLEELRSGNKREVEPTGMVSDGVGILPIYGPIFGKANLMTQLSGATSLEMFRQEFAQMVQDDSIKSIILDVDSPGGTSEMVSLAGDEIFAARDIKPIIAVANGSMGSAAYWLGSQASKVYASTDGMVGSVGAYTVHEDQSGADAKEGIKYSYISAGPYKTEGNPHEPLSQEGRDYRQEMINELYDNFLAAISRGRGVEVDKVRADYGGGRMYNANKAVIAGMIDGKKEFETVVAEQVQSANQSHGFVITHGMKATVSGTSGFAVTGMSNADGQLTVHVSNADYEHSEPGTGSPPVRREREDTDVAIQSGSRRGDLPDNFPNNPANVPPNPHTEVVDNGGSMYEELYELLGVDNDEAVLNRITVLHNQSQELENASNLATEEAKFKLQFPKMWDKMQEDRSKLLEADADKFVAANSRFVNVSETGERTKTAFGLSAIAEDCLKGSYMKAARGEMSLSDFSEFVSTIMAGSVHFGEIGSNQEIEPTNTGGSVQEIRNRFASVVAEIRVQDNLSYGDALKEAAKRYPDLAAAYQGANLTTDRTAN